MHLQLGHVFAVSLLGPGNQSNQGFVDQFLTGRSRRRGERGPPRLGHTAAGRQQPGARPRPGNPNDRDRGRQLAGGKRKDGLAVMVTFATRCMIFATAHVLCVILSPTRTRPEPACQNLKVASPIASRTRPAPTCCSINSSGRLVAVGAAALTEAKSRNKPILLSVG